ncbi:MAG: HalD/BesD family halogenase [Gammaproteobacteria bacterium]
MSAVNEANAIEACGTGAADMVDLVRYPVANLQSVEGAAFVRRCRQQYLDTGLCMLPSFIRPQALQRLAEEANGLAGEAYFCKSTHNAYLTEEDPELPREDVARRQEQTYVGSVAYDRIPETAHLRRLYLWDPLKAFIGGVLGKAEFHRFADPLGACSINVFVEGGEHGWHFDESEFTVTLMLQPPLAGGAFEYVPRIRGRDDEKKIVASVLNGDRSRVVDLPFTAGTLLIFGGRQTLHRVKRVSGRRPRLVPVLCYSVDPQLENSDSVRKLFWGRTGNEAEARA